MGNACSCSKKKVQIQEIKAKPLIGSPDKNVEEKKINQLENQEAPKNMALNLPQNINQIEIKANNGTKKEKSNITI